MADSSSNLNQILATLEQLQLENTTLRESFQELQAATHVLPNPTTEHYALEPKVSMPCFINHVRLVICLQPRRYSDDFRQVGLIGTLLRRQAWFALLVEPSSPLLTNFTAFLVEFEATFGETDKQGLALNKIYALQQGEQHHM